MPKFILCNACGGSGGSSAYLGTFTTEDISQMDDDFVEDYFAGNFDRKCEDCNGLRVVTACATPGCDNEQAVVHSYWTGRTAYAHCFDHSEDARGSAECEAESAAERRFGC